MSEAQAPQIKTREEKIKEIREQLGKLRDMVVELDQKVAGRIENAILALKAYSDLGDFVYFFNRHAKIRVDYGYLMIEVYGIPLVREIELNGMNEDKLFEIYKNKVDEVIKRVVEETTIALNTLHSSIDIKGLKNQLIALEDKIDELEGEEDP